ncbi:MAG: sulfurtransferase [Firmicutes bacterium]|nr:sulfurtransferase [Bacillota bacterium]
MKKLFLLIAILFCCVFAISACASNENTVEPNVDQQNNETNDETNNIVAFTGKYIVDLEYVKNAVGQEDVIFLDARGPEAAASGTIEGAIAMIWQQLADVANGQSGDAMWGTILPADQLSEVLSANGLDMNKEIIIFSNAQGGWGDDGRILWCLVAAGYENVKMVNGGYEYLAENGVPTQKGASEPVPCEVVVTSINEDHLINTDELTANYDNYVVVDVRADEEYNGETLYGEVKGGHLPGAIHIRYTDLFREDSTLKSNEEITAMFTDAGISADDTIVTYCTAGIRSAYMQLILEMCGFENTLNYDESYYRWCAVNEVE